MSIDKELVAEIGQRMGSLEKLMAELHSQIAHADVDGPQLTQADKNVLFVALGMALAVANDQEFQSSQGKEWAKAIAQLAVKFSAYQ